MRKLLLTSAGMNMKEEILKILPNSPSKTKLAHITTAAKPQKDKRYVEKDTKLMSEVGFDVTEIDIEGKTQSQLRKILQVFDVIYVQGGNTFYLLKVIQETGFDKVVKDLIDREVIYIGVSAGSIIAGPTIETAGWKYVEPDRNFVKLKDLTAMNLVPFNIFVHYVPRHKVFVAKQAAKSKYPLKIITDSQAILVVDNKFQLIGKGREIKI